VRVQAIHRATTSERLIRLGAHSLSALLQYGVALHQQGRIAEARLIYRDVLRREPALFDGLYLLGMAHIQSGEREQALDCFQKAVRVQPGSFAAQNNLGNVLVELGREVEALACYDRAITLQPEHAPTHCNRANVLKNLREYALALSAYDTAIRLDPRHADAHHSRGFVLQQLGRLEEALSSYDHAATLQPENPEVWSDRAVTLMDMRQHEQALISCERALSLLPTASYALVNQGLALLTLGRNSEALASLQRAVALAPASALAHNSLGIALAKGGHRPEALSSFDRAIALQPKGHRALANRGRVLLELKQAELALPDLERAQQLQPDLDDLPGFEMHARANLCLWDRFDERLADLVARVQVRPRLTNPFTTLALLDHPEIHHRVASAHARETYPPRHDLGAAPARTGGAKLRIGYYSADLREHAVSYLLAQLIEAHDRNAVEVFGFAFGPQAQDPMRERMAAAFDHFIDVSDRSDVDVARQSRALGIDIAINLGGYTLHERTGIFALRCAPVQVSYLGYLGTMAADYMDYIIADRTVIPAAQRANYTEKVVWMPHCFQVNDVRRQISERVFTRTELGLPESSFVFCCFNANYKILPDTFDSWMRVLQAVPGSVLWLIADNPTAQHNLRTEAQARGVDGSRLVFAGRVAAQDYLARYRAADLFLDTFPYNAGTTASDALWMGVPVLTCTGQSFASRMAASLLHSLGLPDLVTDSRPSYEARAVELAQIPDKLAEVRARLLASRNTSPLFDGEHFARDLERAYAQMHARAQAKLPPEHIELLP